MKRRKRYATFAEQLERALLDDDENEFRTLMGLKALRRKTVSSDFMRINVYVDIAIRAASVDGLVVIYRVFCLEHDSLAWATKAFYTAVLLSGFSNELKRNLYNHLQRQPARPLPGDLWLQFCPGSYDVWHARLFIAWHGENPKYLSGIWYQKERARWLHWKPSSESPAHFLSNRFEQFLVTFLMALRKRFYKDMRRLLSVHLARMWWDTFPEKKNLLLQEKDA